MSTINYQDFYKMLTSCLVIVPKQEVRYYLCGIHIKQDAYGLVIESTDGHRAIQFKTNEFIQGKMEFDIILNGNDVKIFLDKIKSIGYHKTDLNEVEITSLDDDFINFNVDKLKLIDGRYPDINKIIWPIADRKGTEEICFNADYLADLKAIIKPFKITKFKPIKLIFKSSLDSIRATFEINSKIDVIIVIMPARY